MEFNNLIHLTDAARQLEYPQNNKKILDIALAVGFESLPAFDRIFKDINEVSPGEYKKKYE